ncbi:hypothetical protein GCM10010413_33850 [Promicromonospora sukumoe]|uniref:Uncharacterized protein n=1 Tax=Promicromonospora sukumoe TaxID=88382 RepID=A0A7W3PCV9_9MICO|nr:hypothetical protein [Promicromonospora sukumoe]MBA8807330.1 hypothetical protein [Promicromonospora sukumoe]
MRRTASALFGLLLLVIAPAACSGGDTPEDNTAQACSAADDLDTALTNFRSTLSPDATVDDVRAARDELSQAWQTFDSAAKEVAQDRAQELDDAWAGLQKAVDDVAGEATVAGALSTLEDEAQGVKDARDDVVSELGC